jgi:hypothetical protein
MFWSAYEKKLYKQQTHLQQNPKLPTLLTPNNATRHNPEPLPFTSRSQRFSSSQFSITHSHKGL